MFMFTSISIQFYVKQQGYWNLLQQLHEMEPLNANQFYRIYQLLRPKIFLTQLYSFQYIH